MLTTDRVIDYIKRQLGFPFVGIELADNDIEEYLKNYTLKEISYYIPHVEKVYLSFRDPSLKVAGRENEFFIQSPEGLEIMNVKDIFLSKSNEIILGHPYFGALSFGQLREYALSVEMAGMTKSFSDMDITYEFSPPNIIRVSPIFAINTSDGAILEIETVQPSDYSAIPADLEWLVRDFCLADIMILIGRVRKKYGGGNMRTPYGEIPIDAEILDEGKEKKRELIDKMQIALPNIVFDFA